MLRTPLCDLLGISVPIVLAPFGPWDEVGLAAVAGAELVAAIKAGGGEDHLPFAGQSVELIHDVLAAREVIRRLLAGAEAALRDGAGLTGLTGVAARFF